jgi:outer membrane protein TolC
MALALQASAQRTYTLDECLAIAKKQAPALLLAKLAYKVAKENAEASELSLRSTVDLSLSIPSYTESTTPIYDINTGTYELLSQNETEIGGGLNINQPIYWTGGSMQLSGNFYRRLQTTLSGAPSNDYLSYATVSLTQPIFLANTMKIQHEQNTIALELARANYLSQIASLQYSVKSAFYTLYQAQQQLQIQQQSVEISDSAYALAARKYKAGLIAEVEALQAEAAYATAQATLFDNQRSLEAAARNLMITIGQPTSDKGLARLDSLTQSKVEIRMEDAIAQANANRADLLSAKYAIDQSTYAEELTENQRTTNMQLTGNLGLTHNATTIALLYQNPPVNKGVTLTLNVPIFDWGAQALRVDAAKADIEMSTVSYEKTELTVEEGVREAVEQIFSARKQIEVANEAVTISIKAYDLSHARFDNGSISSQDLTLAQQTLTQARTTALNAIVAERLALASLTQQTLYDFENGRPLDVDGE